MNHHNEVDRVTRSKAEARRYYDRLSRWYDLLAGGSERKYKQRCLQQLAVQPGEQVLEIGVGTGECALALARGVGESGSVHGLDLSPGMLAVAGRKLQAAGLDDRVQLECADAANLPYAPASFDAIFSSFTLELFDTPEIAGVLEECRRVLKPGGRLCITSMDKAEQPGWMSRFYNWVHRRFPTVVDCRPIHVIPSIKAAGFEIREARSLSMWGIPVAVVLAAKV
jgi:demethylmenaquinone methyltransferase/2-methoxy-6-polyprenyl-1,4-benzoquinol methylase